MTILKTQRFQLAPAALSDAEQLHRLWTGPGVRRYLFDDEVLSSDRTTELIIESQRLLQVEGTGLWLVRTHGGEEILGFTGFWYFREPPERELLYGVAEKWWGRGVATEVADAMLGYGFRQLGMERVTASTDAGHVASVRVMEKIGMTFIRRLVVNGLDTVFYEATRPGLRDG